MIEPSPHPHPTRGHLPCCVVIALAVLICFGNLVGAEFTSWDDMFNVSLNPHLNPPTFKNIAWYWAHAAYSLYIPVTYSIWGMLAAVAYLPTPDEFGVHLNPWVFHGTNVIAHLIAAIAAYRIIDLVLGSTDRWAACAGAMVFALHPVQVESVGWVAGMKDVLAGMFSFLAVWQYLVSVRSDRRPTARFIVATLLLVLALLSKPSAIVTPLIALVIDRCALRRSWESALCSIWPWMLLGVAGAVVAKFAQPAIGVERAPLWARPFIAGDALAFYLYKLAFPLNLGIDYGRRPQVVMQSGWFYVAWIFPAVLLAWLWKQRRSWPRVWTGALVFLIGVAPVLGFSTFLFQYYSTTTDHYLYLSMLGAGIVVAALLAARPSRAAFALATAALLALGVRTTVQTQTWLNDETLFTNALRVNPNSFIGVNNLGHYYAQLGQPDRALPLFQRAVGLRPDNWRGRENLGRLLADRDIDAAIEQIELAIQLKRRYPIHREVQAEFARDYNSLGLVLMTRKRYADAAEQFREAIKLKPNFREAQDNLKQAIELLSTSATAPATAPR